MRLAVETVSVRGDTSTRVKLASVGVEFQGKSSGSSILANQAIHVLTDTNWLSALPTLSAGPCGWLRHPWINANGRELIDRTGHELIGCPISPDNHAIAVRTDMNWLS